RYLDATAIILPLAVLVAFGLAIGLSEHRRRTLLHAGLGLAFSMAVMLAVLYAGRAWAVSAAGGQDVPHDAAVAFFDTIVRFLRTAVRTGLTIGIVVAAGAWVTGGSTAAVKLRTTTRRGLTGLAEREDWEFGAVGTFVATHKRALRYAIAIVGVLILVVWQRPGPKGVLLLTAIVLVGVAVVEVIGRAVPARPADGNGQPSLFDTT
ncbi:MAG: hypothetical protein JO148_07085, partial [Acidimicrobiia bacterium]|nr:hypothetical protein [Acidimicrobiia bacterium]